MKNVHKLYKSSPLKQQSYSGGPTGGSTSGSTSGPSTSTSTSSSVTWSCDNTTGSCVDPGDGSGTYSSLSSCISNCGGSGVGAEYSGGFTGDPRMASTGRSNFTGFNLQNLVFQTTPIRGNNSNQSEGGYIKTKKGKRKVHTGKRGGKYIMMGGKKKYLK